MEAKETGAALRSFAEIAFDGQPFDIKEFDEAGEIRCQDKTLFVQLYNGHFWNAGTEHGMMSYLGPNPKLAALFWKAQEAQDTEEFETFSDDDAEMLRKVYDEDPWDDDDCIEARVIKFNPLPMAPGIGERLMKTPDEWSERMEQDLSKWESFGWDEDGNAVKGPAYRESTGFDRLALIVQKVCGVRIDHHVYHDEKGEEYACELILGFNKETDDYVKAYLLKSGGAYHDTNGCTIMTFLGCDPEIAGKHFCAQLGYYLPGEEWDDWDDDSFNGPPESSHEYQWRKDFDKYEGKGGTVYYPPEWQEIIAAAQQGFVP